MPNKQYIKGVRKERLLVNQARAQGKIAFRSAGSHSPIDCVIIDVQNLTIELIQSKAGESMSDQKKEELERFWSALNNEFLVSFKVV